jgi:hypothetical protein
MAISKFTDDQPREHHYVFAHRVLPAEARANASAILQAAERGTATQSLAMIWDHVGSQLAPDRRLPSTGLSGSFRELSGARVALIHFPPAEHATEAHLAAIVLPRTQPAGPARYIVLEHSWTPDDQPQTVIGEWADGKHLNGGNGPAPDEDAFLAAVDARVRAS